MKGSTQKEEGLQRGTGRKGRYTITIGCEDTHDRDQFEVRGGSREKEKPGGALKRVGWPWVAL